MKTTPLVLKCVAVLVGIGVLSAPGAKADTNQSKDMPKARVQQQAVQRVILVETTDSRIPKRVVIAGNQVNSSSPLYVLQSRELLRTGAVDVVGMLANEPSIVRGSGIARRH
jgi:hypothetical protein